jgi:hypothetical protein
MSSLGQMPYKPALHLGAGANAASAKDALVEIDTDHRAGIAVVCVSCRGHSLGRQFDLILASPTEQFVLVVRRQGIVYVTRQQHPQDESAMVHNLRCSRSNRHAFDRGLLAGDDFTPEALVLHET